MISLINHDSSEAQGGRYNLPIYIYTIIFKTEGLIIVFPIQSAKNYGI